MLVSLFFDTYSLIVWCCRVLTTLGIFNVEFDIAKYSAVQLLAATCRTAVDGYLSAGIAHLVSLTPWPLTSDLDNFFSNVLSRDYLPSFVQIPPRSEEIAFRGYAPRVGPGHPSYPLVHSLPRLFLFLLFSFFHWLYLFSSFVHLFPFYQNSPTPFPGRRS